MCTLTDDSRWLNPAPLPPKIYPSGPVRASSDSEDINEGPSKGKVPKEDINEGPSKGKLPPLGSSTRPSPERIPSLIALKKRPKTRVAWIHSQVAQMKKAQTMKPLLEPQAMTVRTTGNDLLFYEDTIEKYVPVRKSASKKDIFKSQIPVTGVVLGLANLKTWDESVQKIGKRPPGNSADKVKGKVKV
uniref:Protein kinase-like domain-containing protein n=1 Tax=Tanacetum cinerariifolium TaxID=118510 RepID=A0A6L2ME59_TANCI|nr:protein kinase-like domain-containing protein [Tanacetum cinerariifolium]